MGSFIRFIMMAALAVIFVNCGDRRSDNDDGDGNDVENLASNIYAMHDADSDQYRTDCLSCHSSILTEETLDSSIPTAHNVMLPETPGTTNENKCTYCHGGVDLLNHSAGNIRRQVAVETCDLCHGPEGPGHHLYENPDFATEED